MDGSQQELGIDIRKPAGGLCLKKVTVKPTRRAAGVCTRISDQVNKTVGTKASRQYGPTDLPTEEYEVILEFQDDDLDDSFLEVDAQEYECFVTRAVRDTSLNSGSSLDEDQ